MTSLYDTIVNYIVKYENELNSYVTTETHTLCDNQRNGTITLKWWKEMGILYISHIQLDTASNGKKYLLTETVNALQTEFMINKGLKYIKLIGVANSHLSEKMINKGWDQSEDGLCFKI